MAVKLSSWLWIRNNDLNPLVKEDIAARNFFISEEDRKELGLIIEEMDKIVSFDDQIVDKPLIGPNVVLSGYLEIVQKVSDLEKYGKMLESVHRIMRTYQVRPIFYRRLGEAFAESGAVPKPETMKAIRYGTKMEHECNANIYKRCDRMNWSSIYESQISESLWKTAETLKG